MAEFTSIPEGLITKTAFFSERTPITKLVPAVQQFDAVIINKDDGYFGIIDSREIYRYFANFAISKKQASGRYAIRVPRITDSTSIDDVIYYFQKSRAKALPYQKNDRISGVLKRNTLLKVLLSLDRLRDVKVSDAMVSPVIAIDIKSTVTQAKAAMRANKINRLMVLENDRFAGMVTNYDLIDRYLKPQERLPQRKSYTYTPSNLALESVVQRNPRTIDYNRSLKDAVRDMVENGISSLVVTRGDKPVGILTELDIITSAAAGGGMEGNKVLISGLDSDTYQYEDEIRSMLKVFIEKTERMSRIRVDYISVVVKKFKSKSYEMHARLSLGKQGIINAHVTGHIMERTMGDVLNILSREVKERKERYLSIRKIYHTNRMEEA